MTTCTDGMMGGGSMRIAMPAYDFLWKPLMTMSASPGDTVAPLPN